MTATKTLDLLFLLNLLIFLPFLVVQSRMLHYKLLEKGERKDVFEVLLEELPHDLAVMGMALVFAAYALVGANALYSTKTILIVYPFLPFIMMSTLPLVNNK